MPSLSKHTQRLNSVSPQDSIDDLKGEAEEIRLSESETLSDGQDCSDTESDDSIDDESTAEAQHAKIARRVTAWLDQHFDDEEEEEEGHRVNPKIEAIVRDLTIKAQQIIWNIHNVPRGFDEEGQEEDIDTSVGFCTLDVFDILSNISINRGCKFSWGMTNYCEPSQRGEDEGEVVVWGE